VYCSACGSKARGILKRRIVASSSKNHANGGLSALGLPKRREKKTVIDWRQSGRELNDFLEK